MKLNMIRNARKNVIFGTMNRSLMMLFPFLNRTVFLWLLGPEYLGLNGLFSSLLSVLTLAELGFGTAVVCYMYKLIAEDDKIGLRRTLNFYRKIFHLLGVVILLAGLLLLPFLRHLIHGAVPDDINLTVLYLIHLGNVSLGHFLYAYKEVLLEAYQRMDIQAKIRSAVALLQYSTTFLILIFTRSYYLYVLSSLLFTVMQNLIIHFEIKMVFPHIVPLGVLPPEERKEITANVFNIFLNRIGTVVSYSADNLVISFFLGLVAVAAYGNYYYVYTAVSGFCYVFYSSLTAGFGNTIHTASVSKNFTYFMKAGQIAMMLVTWCCAVMLATIQPFIRYWTHHDPALVQPPLTAFLLVLYFYVNYSRQMLLTFKMAAGIWKQDRFKALTSGLVNLTLNFAMIHSLGLNGVLLSTIISFLAVEIPWESRVTFRYYFDAGRSNGKFSCQRSYWRFQASSALRAAAIIAVTALTTGLLPEGSVWHLLNKGVAAALTATLGVIILYRKEAFRFFRLYRQFDDPPPR